MTVRDRTRDQTVTEASQGAPSKPLAKRVVHLVDERVREDQPAVALTEVVTIARHLYARDAATTSPAEAVEIALANGDLMLVRHPATGRRYLGPVDIATARFALGDDPTPARVREIVRHEAEGRGRREVVAVWNQAAADLRDADTDTDAST